MIINRNFIDQLLEAFYESFNNEKDWCEVSGLNPDIEIYGKHKYQKLYALKYLPAYYFEYCILASKLYTRLCKNEQDNISVASLGCGLSPDYYALQHNLMDKNFTYHGYDAYEWKMQELMPQVEDNYNFIWKSIRRLDESKISQYDVFIFPKSIGDINDSSKLYTPSIDLIEQFANVLAKTSKNRIYFLNSYVSKDFQNTPHVKLFEKIHNKLLSSGFKSTDNYKETFYRGEKGKGLKGIDYEFHYNSEYCIRCEDEDAGCRYCNVIKSPILTNKFMDFQILEYTR
ncbi:hypothetical protein BWI04_RS03530 [Vibrio parahaemolyticus]|nr:hypothetical protein [Vibrio parahaemolyticus]EGR1171196.1 hypothetical protein [Vibrio parahaemolyticus]EJG1661546.1 hypothetical protein [Vibrio parahaemolyticus]EJG1679970.1 hypothetical protein [Vibrio parahaemolyticus]EJG1769103.1 hypothetical protein [Vibrio parahaemolyticus]